MKVSDFGLSALVECRRKDGLLHTTCGTPAYVAPEVISKKGYDGAKSDIWSCGVVLFVLIAGYLPFHDSNLMEMYRKISKADFKCPFWFSPDLRRLLCRILDPSPSTRITITKIMDNSWFKKGYKQVEFLPKDTTEDPGIRTSIGDVDSIFFSSDNKKVESPTPIKQTSTMNAFDIISLLPGFDLSGLFEMDAVEKKAESRFMTQKPASAIVSKLEELAQNESFRVKKRDGLVTLEGNREGKKGRLSIDAEIFEVTPCLYMVEVKQSAGDALEYQRFCSQDLKPSLAGTWQGDHQQRPSL